jgi:hypothetical protein
MANPLRDMANSSACTGCLPDPFSGSAGKASCHYWSEAQPSFCAFCSDDAEMPFDNILDPRFEENAMNSSSPYRLLKFSGTRGIF